MSRRTASSSVNGPEKSSSGPGADGGQDKQVRLLSADAGHFSMVRALHLADWITAGNGESFMQLSRTIKLSIPWHRLLRHYVDILVDAVLPWRAVGLDQRVDGAGLHAIRTIFRLLRRQSGSMARQELADGPGARLTS